MNDTARRGYPLAALFVVVAACAALAAAVTPAVRTTFQGNMDEELLLGVIVGSIAGCVLLGTIVGLLNYRWLIGAATGAVVGVVIGIVAGLLAMTPTKQLVPVAASLLVGSGLMVGIAMLLRPRN